jgi:hypothetical protein
MKGMIVALLLLSASAFLLYKGKEDLYGSVNGRFAVIPIERSCAAK